MSIPSIKGAAVGGTVDLVHEALASGRISREHLTIRLEPGDLVLIDEKIEQTLWYPIDSVARIGELLVETLGAGSYDFMVGIGQETAARFQREGVFAAFIQDAASRGERMGPVLVRISELALNFARWSFEGDSMEDFTVRVAEAGELPESTRYSVEGFIRTLASDLAGVSIVVESSRPQPDIVLFRGRRDAAD